MSDIVFEALISFHNYVILNNETEVPFYLISIEKIFLAQNSSVIALEGSVWKTCLRCTRGWNNLYEM